MFKNKKNILIISSFLVVSLFNSLSTANIVHADEEINVLNLDTDGDGLKDINEFLILDPRSIDSDQDGILDGDEDSDHDGLSNLEEQEYKTKLNDEDSDSDGLNDKDEIYKYQTNPNDFDTDGDNLSDGIEIEELALDPNNPDEDQDNVLDGDVEREFDLPKNKFMISGEMIGKSNVPLKVVIRETPILLVQKIEAQKKFDILSLDPDIKFKISIPFEPDSDKEDYELYRYEGNEVMLSPIAKQKWDKEKNIIETEFTGGGTFVIISKETWKNSLHTEKKLEKQDNKVFKNKAKLSGLAGFTIESKEVQEDGTFKIKKTIEFTDDDIISLDEEDAEGKRKVTLETTYKIKEVYQDSDGETYITASAISAESGHVPTILVHGLNGGLDTWGFEDPWAHNFQSKPEAQRYISSSETFSGDYYYDGEEVSWGNPDIHFITYVTDWDELGPELITDYNYTPNVDLFGFIYNADGLDGCVSTAGDQLFDYIKYLRENVFENSRQDVNIVAHSMGGLVSRFTHENISSAYIDRIITLGTPHFGSDKAPFGDLDRSSSELWDPDSDNMLENDNSLATYVGIAGWEESNTVLSGVEDIYATGLGIPSSTYPNWDYYVRKKYLDRTGKTAPSGDIEDSWVNIDSALGSDYDPERNFEITPALPVVEMNYRFLIWDSVYGDHSLMRKHERIPYYVHRALSGTYDDNSPD